LSDVELLRIAPAALEETKCCSDELKELHRWIRGVERQMVEALAPLAVERERLVQRHNALVAELAQLRAELKREHDPVTARAYDRGDGEALDALEDFWVCWDQLELHELPVAEEAWVEEVELPEDLPRELDLLPTRCVLTSD
jgi:hypothetical protein